CINLQTGIVSTVLGEDIRTAPGAALLTSLFLPWRIACDAAGNRFVTTVNGLVYRSNAGLPCAARAFHNGFLLGSNTLCCLPERNGDAIHVITEDGTAYAARNDCQIIRIDGLAARSAAWLLSNALNPSPLASLLPPGVLRIVAGYAS